MYTTFRIKRKNCEEGGGLRSNKNEGKSTVGGIMEASFLTPLAPTTEDRRPDFNKIANSFSSIDQRHEAVRNGKAIVPSRHVRNEQHKSILRTSMGLSLIPADTALARALVQPTSPTSLSNPQFSRNRHRRDLSTNGISSLLSTEEVEQVGIQEENNVAEPEGEDANQKDLVWDVILGHLMSIRGPLQTVAEQRRSRVLHRHPETSIRRQILDNYLVSDPQTDLNTFSEWLTFEICRRDTGLRETRKRPGFISLHFTSRFPLRITDPHGIGDMTVDAISQPLPNGLYVCRIDLAPGEVRNCGYTFKEFDNVPSSIKDRLLGLLYPEEGTLSQICYFLDDSEKKARCCSHVAKDLLRRIKEPQFELNDNLQKKMEEWATPFYKSYCQICNDLDQIIGSIIPSCSSIIQTLNVSTLALADAGFHALISLAESWIAELIELRDEVEQLRFKTQQRTQVSETLELANQKISNLTAELVHQEVLYTQTLQELEQQKEKVHILTNVAANGDLPDEDDVDASNFLNMQKTRRKLIGSGKTKTKSKLDQLDDYVTTPKSEITSPLSNTVPVKPIVDQRTIGTSTIYSCLVLPWKQDVFPELDEDQFTKLSKKLREAVEGLVSYKFDGVNAFIGPGYYDQQKNSTNLMQPRDSNKKMIVKPLETALTLGNKAWMTAGFCRINNTLIQGEIAKLQKQNKSLRKALKESWNDWTNKWALNHSDIQSCWKDIIRFIELKGEPHEVKKIQINVTNFEKERAEENWEHESSLREYERLLGKEKEHVKKIIEQVEEEKEIQQEQLKEIEKLQNEVKELRSLKDLPDEMKESKTECSERASRVATAFKDIALMKKGKNQETVVAGPSSTVKELQKCTRKIAFVGLAAAARQADIDDPGSEFFLLPQLLTELDCIWSMMCGETKTTDTQSGLGPKTALNTASIPLKDHVSSYFLQRHGSMKGIRGATVKLIKNIEKYVQVPQVALFAYFGKFVTIDTLWEDKTENHNFLMPHDEYQTFSNPTANLLSVFDDCPNVMWQTIQSVRNEIITEYQLRLQLGLMLREEKIASPRGQQTVILKPNAPIIRKDKANGDRIIPLSIVFEIVTRIILPKSKFCLFLFYRALLEFTPFDEPEGKKELYFFSIAIQAYLRTLSHMDESGEITEKPPIVSFSGGVSSPKRQHQSQLNTIDVGQTLMNNIATEAATNASRKSQSQIKSKSSSRQIKLKENDELQRQIKERYGLEVEKVWNTIVNCNSFENGLIEAGVINEALIPRLRRAFKDSQDTPMDVKFSQLFKTYEDIEIPESCIYWSLLVALVYDRQRTIDIVGDLFEAFDDSDDSMMQFSEFQIFTKAVSGRLMGHAELEKLFMIGLGSSTEDGEEDMSKDAFLKLILGGHVKTANIQVLEELQEQKRREIIATWT